MTPIKLTARKTDFEFEFGADIARIVRVCAARGYDISEDEAHKVWEMYSASMAAGWMMQPVDDNDLVNLVLCWTDREV
ncbi:MAG: hypothetical protein IPO08_23700 [Xanthomonadales bacterium]|nr:hypothetical protein [Xanthomonadales bacterium]